MDQLNKNNDFQFIENRRLSVVYQLFGTELGLRLRLRALENPILNSITLGSAVNNPSQVMVDLKYIPHLGAAGAKVLLGALENQCNHIAPKEWDAAMSEFRSEKNIASYNDIDQELALKFLECISIWRRYK